MLLFPNAKINIGLNIVSRRADNYHNIETVFYPISLCDRLNVSRKNKLKSCRLSLQGIDIDGNTDNNLVQKTYRLFQECFDIQGGVDVLLKKQIPVGGGLGGGSADAAFMAKALNELYKLNLTDEQLMGILAELGSDCPFFVHNKPVFAEGTGNIFTPINLDLSGWVLVLVTPSVHISTAEAYAGVEPQAPPYKIADIISQKPITEWRHYIKNDFEEAVFAQNPLLGTIKEQLYAMGATYASMSGSGASVYGLFRKMPSQRKVFKSYFTFCQVL